MTFCKLLTVLVLMHNCGGLLGAEVESSIIGGENAEKGGWPWMVYLSMFASQRNKWRCGGTLLNDQWVLTAASCWDKNPKPIDTRCGAWLGTHDLKKASERYMKIYTHMKHPGYQAVDNGFINDLDLVKLNKTVEFTELVKPIRLPRATDSFDSSSECWITGWGNVGEGEPLPSPGTLQQLRISIIPQDVCRRTYPHLTDEQLCAGDMAGGKDACEGDYGGPLVCRRGGGDFVLAGIMSYGSCGARSRPGVYTRVSSYVGYINSYINQGEEASAEF